MGVCDAFTLVSFPQGCYFCRLSQVLGLAVCMGVCVIRHNVFFASSRWTISALFSFSASLGRVTTPQLSAPSQNFRSCYTSAVHQALRPCYSGRTAGHRSFTVQVAQGTGVKMGCCCAEAPRKVDFVCVFFHLFIYFFSSVFH